MKAYHLSCLKEDDTSPIKATCTISNFIVPDAWIGDYRDKSLHYHPFKLIKVNH